MSIFLALLLALSTTNAYATIDGPSCSSLTKEQDKLLLDAAKSYANKTYKKKIKAGSLKVTDADCHDYDGVHSASEFTADWTQIDEDQEMGCSVELRVSVGYDQKKKLKTINKSSKFEVEAEGEPDCQN